MAKEKDTALMDVYKYIETCDSSVASSLSTKSSDSYEILQKELNSVTDSLGMKDTWDDAISLEISSGVKTGIDGMISACKTPADQIIASVGTAINTLVMDIKSYSDKVDEYNSQESKLNNLGSCPPQYETVDGQEKYNPAYTTWQNDNSRIRGIMSTLEKEIDTWYKASNDQITFVRSLLSSIGSEKSTAALGSAVVSVTTYEGTPLEEFGYGDGYKIQGTVVKDANGNIISETYYIINNDNVVVQSGTITYNADGTKNIEKYIVTYEEPTTTVKIEEKKETLKEESAPEVLAYLDEDVVPETETVTRDIDIYQAADGNGEDYTQTEHSEQEFTDGTTVVSDTTTTGNVEVVPTDTGDTEKVLVPEESTETGTITTADGNVVDYETHTVYEDGKKDEATTVLTEDGKELATVDTDYVANYDDGMTGCEVDVQSNVVTTEATTTTKTSVVYKTDDNGVAYADEVVVTRDNSDPSCGSMRYSDGSGYDVTRNEKGELVVTEYYEDKNGEIKQSDSEVIPDATNSTFTVTNPDNTTETYQLNMSNPLDQFTVSNSYQTARMDEGYNAESAMEGCHFLWNGDGDPVEVQNPWGDDETGYSFSLKYN